MRIAIIHTPADRRHNGLLNHLSEILVRGAVEVSTLMCGGAQAPLQQAFNAALQRLMDEEPPDAIVLSDRLNGTKRTARNLARERGVGVLTLKETVFPERAYFAPDPAATKREGLERRGEPLEDYEKFRLDQFLGYEPQIREDEELYAHLAMLRPALLVVDLSAEQDAHDEGWHVDAADAADSAGAGILVCLRDRDVCAPEQCGQVLLLRKENDHKEIPCADICMERVIRASRCVITNGSLLGLKALHGGRQVIVAGDCAYSGMGFTRDVPWGADFKQRMGEALKAAEQSGRPRGYERFLYDFIYRDLLPLEGRDRFAKGAEGRVIDALFRALPLERGARVLSGV